ncbi:hypothetical protein B9Z55_006261 [Caenorhabditis nigoni]|uniref:Peptidase M13 C-terminal domain-containing protein n=1 Tax=Caenorhabditis nigoni TaxID=1611254 RepID=A0A2G5V4G8_9PELO|nr:hypothetical protein B9Z55_006261 [Caenorhabditis nigoni]
MVTTLSSICVLEYLSFERRQYIASQIPGFRKVVKSLPLHLDSLAISVDKIRIDQNEYYSTNRRSNNFYLCINELRKRLIQNPIIDGTVFLSAIFEKDRVELEKLMLDLIGNRSMIYTKELAFLDPWLYRFPEKLKIQAEIIEDRLFPLSLEDLDRIANILGPKPLKEFSTQLNNYQIFTHPIVRNSQKLVLWSGSEDFDHRRINHRNIHLKDYDRRILINHMNAWIANVNEVEKEFSGDIEVSGDNNLKLLEEEISIKEMMYLEKCKSGGKRVKANESIADFSVDPCDDFYAHVCPMGTTKQDFLSSIWETKRQIVRDYKFEHPENLLVKDFSVEKTRKVSEIVTQFLHSEESLTLCNFNKKIVSIFTRHLLEFNIGESDSLGNWKRSSCEQKMEMVRELPYPTQKFINSRMILSQAMDGSIANSLMKKLDKKLRQLFPKLKMGVLKELRRTPWAVENGALEMYEDALQKINFTTFSDIRKPIKHAQSVFIQAKNKCIDLIHGKYSMEIEDGICEVIAVGGAVRYINKPIESVYQGDLRDILTDQTAAFNSKDYGGIGFSMTHEILHTLVFDYRDFESHNSLAEFWTKDAKCVEEQTRKTCETFPTVTCDTKETFEEDAADLAAYRIVWNLYKKAYIRKTVVEKYEDLDKKQLFFYGAAVVFCSPNGMEKYSYHDTNHSNVYQRVNSLMSQMDGFSEAFKCKPSDRMVRNRARTCELYGSKAERKRKLG